MTLHLVPAAEASAVGNVFTAALPRCKGCNHSIRPHGSSEAGFPGTVPSWGNNECRICDYEACGKDPADRFISVERVGYLAGIRTDIETGRKRRGVPAEGTRTGRIPLTEFLQQIS